MKITDIVNESTTAGSIATVASPMTTQSRNASIYGGKKGGNLLTGKKTKAKYANSKVNESFDTKQKVIDYFVKKGKTAAQGASAWERGWRGPKSKTSNTPVANKPRVDHMAKYDLDEAKLEEAVNHEKKIETLTNQVKALQNRLEVARERRRMQAQRGRGAGRIQSDAETKISSKIAKLRDEIETHRQALKNLNETHLEEDDVILVPGQGHRLKTGFHAFDPDKAEHEGETLKNSLRTIARNAKELHGRLQDSEQFPEWVSEKIGQIKGMITSVTEYLISHQEGDAAPEHEGVIAGGGVGESLANWNMGVQSIPRTSEWKRKAITAVMPGAMGKEYTFDTEQEAIQHFGKDAWEKIKAGVPTKSGKPWEVIYADDVTEGVKEKIKGAIRREKAKDLPLVQTRRDYAMGKAGQAYEKGETRKGNQYSAYAERDRKKKGDTTTNPAGTYRTKTSDYTNEGKDKQGDDYKAWRKKNFNDKKTTDDIVKGSDTRTKYDLDEAQSMGAALKNTLAKAEPGSKLDNSIKAHNRHIKAGLPGTLKNAPTGYHFDSKGYCRLGDK